jgi:superoxide dismutase, Fe-Mn family
MKKYNEIKKLNFSKLEGISDKTIEIHHGQLYQGYVKKWQEIQEKITLADKTLANAVFSDLRELKVEESFVNNAIILHEAYFDILGGDGKTTNQNILEAISKYFGSLDNWQEEFMALGLASRGWVILAYDFNDGQLRNYLLDAHNLYGVVGIAPILVMDMYEHAYITDFGTNKKLYIETFFQNLNWQVIDLKFNNVIQYII